jgi:glycosyltransferase involved in cell wall biosynthesis
MFLVRRAEEVSVLPTPTTVPSPDPPGEVLVSVVMPCLNEADGVGICVEKARRALDKMGVPGEVLVVDNGSTDGSAEIAARAGARVVHERRRGYGAAYLRGFHEARGKYLIMGDADDTYDFADIAPFVEPLAAGGVDMVMGTRLRGTILPGAMSWSHRWIGNPILSGMLKLMFKTSISDSHCGMRSFTREAYQQMNLRTQGMEFASEIVVNALRAGLRIREIPITYRPRIGESKLVGLRDAWRHVRFMLVYSPSYLFQLPGLLLALVGALLVAALAGGPREFLGRQWDYHGLLFGAIALILGWNLVLFDVIAKTFSMGAGLARPGKWLARLTEWFTLERGLVIGGLMFVLGAGLEVKIVLDWARAGYGPLMAVRGIVIGMAAMVLGAQTAFASFLVSLLLIKRR